MPWNSLKGVPKEHRQIAERARWELRDANSTARDTLQRSEKWEPGWSFDQDPSPQRVLRTREDNAEEMVAVETKDTGKYQRPSSLVTKNGQNSTQVEWTDGEITSLKSVLVTDDGSREDLTITINNENGTLTYTTVETGQFAEDAMKLSSLPASPGDSGGFYEDWNSEPGYESPDYVYDEFDNGRGEYFDGPDGRTYYDPY